MRQIIYLLFLLNSFNGITQDFSLEEKKQIDSLSVIWNNKELADTIRADAYKSCIVNYYLYNSPDSANVLAQELYKFAEQKKLQYRMSTALLLEGVSNYFVKSYEKALHCFNRCLKLRIASGNQIGIASVFNNIGLVYFEQGDYSNALKYYLKSLKIEEKLKNEKGISATLSNIGLIYKDQADYGTALKFYNRSLKIKIEIGDKMGESHALVNIGVVYMIQGSYEDALSNFEQALIANEGYEEGLNAQINYNIGSIQYDLGNYGVALGYVNQALNTQEQLNDRLNESASLNLIANINFKQNSTLKAIYFASKALKIAQEIGAKKTICNAAENLSKYYKAIKRHKESLDMFTLFIETRDELQKNKYSKDIVRQEVKYEYDKKAAKDSLKNAFFIETSKRKINNEREKKELAEQKNLYLYGSLFFTLIFGGFIYNRFKVTSNQKSVIETQKQTVDKTNKELNRLNGELSVKKNEIDLQKRIVQANNQKLKESLKNEKELSLLKNRFVSTVSHQFRTPLAVIQSNVGILEMFADKKSKEEFEKHRKVNSRITGAIAKMTSLMDDVLILGKLTSGHVSCKQQEFDLVEFCNELIERFNSIQGDGRILNFKILGEPCNVFLDPKLLTHSLSNLLSNAFKYSFGKKNPELVIDFSKKELVISIKDYGIGIPKTEISNLFQPFFRANNVTEIKGTGLGLSITKEYVEINKGRIAVQSILGEGSCFKISFKKHTL
ncbi:MAG: signal transduction histidine kinase [Salibacteraceae bacterium]|jgi:signal transduction histidine kinase